ncbi:GNAT family N-acetyltransferase [Leptotrichia sp. OH3620_COT-345]|uniref:GNAT family N-acetyltransferase n=1 Tax=Leptotrichia sp. OH3620_COT-345 TaxID=2491048 RepID=UPI000F655E69|nr:GNAT family N-acetyltransferase [Leptotrichia sp. OH3620_COT-345]RRD40952.1 GNAT family N-acetyltransferase [Leptotrichia sp. OH3620_COT-345]
MNWICKQFNELTSNELFLIFKERVTVFVVEQNCPYQEIDDNDLIATHIYKINDGKIVAYCRIIPMKDGIHLGRVLVRESSRKSGIGRELVSEALKIIKKKWGNKPVYAQAQAYLEKFYSSFGFKAVSDVYLEDNIPHLDMILS